MARPVKNTLALDLPLEEAWERFIRVDPAQLTATSGQSAGGQKAKSKTSQRKVAKTDNTVTSKTVGSASKPLPKVSKRRSK